MPERQDGQSYDPHKLVSACEKIAHGKARMAAYRSAAELADAHEDTPFRIYFRVQLCEESTFYGDSLDMLVIFPEVLAIIDRWPDTPSTCYKNNYKDSLGYVLWVYKWIIGSCDEFYQIPMADCRKFYEDYKKRCLAYGYNLRTYHMYRYYFYDSMGRDNEAQDAFHAFEELPRDRNSNCRACERNTTIGFYLDQGDLKKAEELSQEIESFQLRCGHDRKAAWLRMKGQYMSHYLDKGDFRQAEIYCRMIEQNMIETREYQDWDSFLYCYAHTDMGKALKIYKAHWKEWEEERNPSSAYYQSKNIMRFFKELSAVRQGKTVKLALDASFPLYRESGRYKITDLYQYYYRKAKDMAERFDARNGTDSFCRWLEEAVNEGEENAAE